MRAAAAPMRYEAASWGADGAAVAAGVAESACIPDTGGPQGRPKWPRRRASSRTSCAGRRCPPAARSGREALRRSRGPRRRRPRRECRLCSVQQGSACRDRCRVKTRPAPHRTPPPAEPADPFEPSRPRPNHQQPPPGRGQPQWIQMGGPTLPAADAEVEDWWWGSVMRGTSMGIPYDNFPVRVATRPAGTSAEQAKQALTWPANLLSRVCCRRRGRSRRRAAAISAELSGPMSWCSKAGGPSAPLGALRISVGCDGVARGPAQAGVLPSQSVGAVAHWLIGCIP